MKGEVSFEYLVLMALLIVLTVFIVGFSAGLLSISQGAGEHIDLIMKGLERVIK